MKSSRANFRSTDRNAALSTAIVVYHFMPAGVLAITRIEKECAAKSGNVCSVVRPAGATTSTSTALRRRAPPDHDVPCATPRLRHLQHRV
jgi:hypothetical protein